MSVIADLVREQIMAEGPDLNGNRQAYEDYVDDQLNAMSNVELLERISDAISKQATEHLRPWL